MSDDPVVLVKTSWKVAPKTMARLKARTDRNLRAVRVSSHAPPPDEADEASGVVETTEGLEAARQAAVRGRK